ncbi:hypothetical protein UFOVP51_36 [uncultured Caudovirales phage]|uniref:Uncharacterized protein n=1 Tax=uncultured Caudovirales phage TaxID=2100421 RepID=A0A6J5KSJ7_9CAUD|nr:hypothetical protein UFOVP51_36 [uncultured Caudovirales phage]CAB4241067.1 hypothetical protein UFOVP34_70 [uncultured Caudovirales phage]
MKEKIENVISLIGEIKDYSIENEHEEAQEITNTILELLDELQFIMDDEAC